MTRLGVSSPVVRETSACYQRRALIVELHPAYLVVRLKGLRSAQRRYSVSYDTVYELGAKLQYRLDQAEKLSRRKQSRRAQH